MGYADFDGAEVLCVVAMASSVLVLWRSHRSHRDRKRRPLVVKLAILVLEAAAAFLLMHEVLRSTWHMPVRHRPTDLGLPQSHFVKVKGSGMTVHMLQVGAAGGSQPAR
jgi:hypothetical protein